MRYVVGILEALLALACFGTVVSQLMQGSSGGTVGFAGSAVIFALGFWFAKMAIGNLKPAKPEDKPPT